MIALLLLSAVAGAQTQKLGACESFQPIAGTAGFANGLAAVRTNAATYGAGAFARQRLRGRTYLAMDFHLVAGAAQVPSWCADSEGRISQQLYSQPLDLGATNLGVNLPIFEDGPVNSRLKAFYASSVTASVMGGRYLTWSGPLLNLYPAFLAPVIGRSSTGRGLAVYAVDWIGGATFGSDVVSVQAGYTGTRGLYLDVTQEKVALFVNTVLADGIQWSDASYLMGGISQFDPLELGADVEKVGMTSAFYRDIAQADAPESREVEEERSLVDRLRTGHFRQEDVLRTFDLRAAWQFGPQGRLRELAAAAHSPEWYPRRDRRRSEDLSWYVRAGVVNLPDQPTLGVDGGVRPTLRADVWYQVGNTDVYGVRIAARMNDPDLLDLYPFAYNALGVNFELTYTGGPP